MTTKRFIELANKVFAQKGVAFRMSFDKWSHDKANLEMKRGISPSEYACRFYNSYLKNKSS